MSETIRDRILLVINALTDPQEVEYMNALLTALELQGCLSPGRLRCLERAELLAATSSETQLPPHSVEG